MISDAMRQRTKNEREVMQLHEKLPPISEKQKEYARKHCHEGIGYKCNGLVWCTKCGCEFAHEVPDLGVAVGVGDKAVCPNCGEKLNVKVSRKSQIDEKYYYTVVTTAGGWQVLRHYEVERWTRRISKHIDGCQAPKFCFRECVQEWINSEGKRIVVARAMNYISGGVYSWVYSKPMQIRKPYRGYSYNPDPYSICAHTVYPWMGVITILRRNGLKGELPIVPLSKLMISLLTDSRAETMMKAGQKSVLAHLVNWGGFGWWNELLICIRNHYIIDSASLWIDMVVALEALGKDTRNAHYVCPENLKEAHDYWVGVKRRRDEKRKAEEKRKHDLEWEKKYKEKKGKFFGMEIHEGRIVIKVIESVKEMQEEGEAMHHCVAANGYYKKDGSLILSARDAEGKRLETIEVNLNAMRIVQCFGVCNRTTEYHKEIVDLMNRNMYRIAERMK